MAIVNEVKKKRKGRLKIEMNKIEKPTNRLIAFSKRRLGLFKKASELSILTGAEIAVIVISDGGCLHPTAQAIVDRFTGGGGDQAGGIGGSENRGCSGVCTVGEEYGGRSGGAARWWEAAAEGMGVEEFGAALEGLVWNVDLWSSSIQDF